MFSLGQLWRRLGLFANRDHHLGDLDDEVEAHIALMADENVRKGMSPKEARLTARREFGHVDSLKENVYDTWGMALFLDLRRDVSLGIRQLVKDKGFAIVVAVTLGIGIGACTAIFGLLNTVLFSPLPFKDPERLAWIQSKRTSGLAGQTFRVDNFLEWKEQNDSFESMGAYMPFFDYFPYILADEKGNSIRRLRAVGITEGFLETLGTPPLLGRTFIENELLWNAPGVAILSFSLWKRQYRSDPNAVGTSININGQPTEIVGVMPPTFDFADVFNPGYDVDILIPFPLVEETNRSGNSLLGVGRLKRGTSFESADADLKLIMKRIHNRLGNGDHPFANEANVDPLNDRVRSSFRLPLYTLSGAVACVLAIACANIANLLLARSCSRKKEFSMRIAMGATRCRLMRQTLAESLALSCGGLVVGVPLAYIMLKWIAGLQEFSIPLLQNASINGYEFIFIIAISAITGVACGVIPAIKFSKNSPLDTLGDESYHGSSGGNAAWMRRSFISIEVALSCMLLICAGLLIRSFDRLLDVDLGFTPQNAIAWEVDSGREFNSDEERANFYDSLARTIEEIPGIDAVGLTDTLPLGHNREWAISPILGEGQYGPTESAFFRTVDTGYAKAMGISIKAGRFFDGSDTADAQIRGLVVSESLANQLWENQEAVGKYAIVISLEHILTVVVGVVEDVRHSSLEASPGGEMYLNLHQNGDMLSPELVVRSEMPLELLIATVQRGLREYSETIPVGDFESLQAIVDNSVAPRQLVKTIILVFSLVALALALVGLYGAITYAIKQRTQEIGIRMAIGATPHRIVRMILGEGAAIVGVGISIGLAGAFSFSRLLRSMLFEVTATDPSIFAFCTLIVLLVSITAMILPALRASKNSPVEALRAD